MSKDLKTAVIYALEHAPNDRALGEYFIKLSKQLNPPKYDDSMKSLLNHAESRLAQSRAPRLMLTLGDDFAALSKFFFLTSGLHVIGAPSGHGKTFWAMTWAERAAKQGNNVLVISLEMNGEDLSNRTLSQISDLPLAKLVADDLNEVQRALLLSMLSDERQEWMAKVFVDHYGDYDWFRIYPKLIERMIQLKPKLVIIDYIQMISNSDTDDSRVSAVLSDIARELKLFADQTDAAVIILSQLNREAMRTIRVSTTKEVNQIPLSSEYIKESGGIVEAADSVQLICIPARLPACPPNLLNKFQVSIQKSRRIGSLGTVLFNFDYEKMKFL